MASNNMNLMGRLTDAANSLSFPEEMLGKGLNQPFNCSNSGARKILYAVQTEHVIQVDGAEKAIVSTGYENRFGDRSSSIKLAENDMRVIAKIPVYSFAPLQHYYMIAQDLTTGVYRVYERRSFEHTTESHGYMYNNSFIDSVSPGDHINKGDTIRTSNSYDEYGNRQDGVNLWTAYLCTDKTMEDSVIVSETARWKLATNHIHKISIPINANDIGLNLYGTNDEPFKILPDIGQKVKDGIVCGIRRENKEEFLYTQSGAMLKKLLISDDKYTTEGTVVDIDVKCNNPAILDSISNSQIKKYHMEKKRFSQDIVDCIEMIYNEDPSAKFEYELQKLVKLSKDILNDHKYMKDKVFSNIIIDMYIIEKDPLNVGDKVSDRYGGKGVVSFIFPDWMMPRDEFGNIVDIIINQSTCVNRENPGQLFETSLTHIGDAIIHHLNGRSFDIDYAIDQILKYIYMIVPEQGEVLEEYLKMLDPDQRAVFIDNILNTGHIKLSLQPISNNMTIQKLRDIYKAFPWIQQNTITVPLIGSNGKPRYIEARRKIIVAPKYMFRLKQYAEDKFSSTSMSATNIKNQNTRSKNAKRYKSLHSNTPIAMGNMEIDDLAHIGMEQVVSMLMLHSVSPKARRLCEQMLTGDPFDIDIKIDDASTNRSVEILNAYLKTLGLRLEFTRKLKQKQQLVTFDMVRFDKNGPLSRPLVTFN